MYHKGDCSLRLERIVMGCFLVVPHDQQPMADDNLATRLGVSCSCTAATGAIGIFETAPQCLTFGAASSCDLSVDLSFKYARASHGAPSVVLMPNSFTCFATSK
jgi:hypothetical protein